MAQHILYFMSVGVSATPAPEQSFEELRTQDYLAAYHSTGRPPAPCPLSPDTPNARAALGLPPLFVPAAIPAPPEPNGDTPDPPAIALPATHDFHATRTLPGEHFQSIAAQPLYANFSHEVSPSVPHTRVTASRQELRYHAYIAGHKTAPASAADNAHPFYAHDARSTAYLTSSAVPGTPDYFMSIVASPKFDKHSFEELRIAYRLAGKEVGSSEIPSRGALPAQSAPTLFGRPRGDAFSSGSLKFL